MRRLSALAMVLLFASMLFAGGSSESASDSRGETEGDILIAYFSWAENNDGSFHPDAASTSSLLSPGNVEELALFANAIIGGDIHSIRVEDPYPASWDECLDRANDERRHHVHPTLMPSDLDISCYDIIFLGYPNWWYGIPMALYSFFETYDLSGKQIYLFCSHGTGGLARSVEEIREALPDSTISSNVFHINEHRAHDGYGPVLEWLQSLGFDTEE